MDTQKCSSGCPGRFYPAQLETLRVRDREYQLCPECVKAIESRMADKHFVGAMYRSTMPLDEWRRLRDEGRDIYAWSAFDFTFFEPAGVVA